MKIKFKWKIKMSGFILLFSLPEIHVVEDAISVPHRSLYWLFPHLLWLLTVEVLWHTPTPLIKERLWRFCHVLNVSIPAKNFINKQIKYTMDLWTHWTHSEMDLSQTSLDYLTSISLYSNFWARVVVAASRNYYFLLRSRIPPFGYAS